MDGDVEMTLPIPSGRQNLEMSLPKDIIEKKSSRKITVGLVALSLILGGAIASLSLFYRRGDIIKSTVLIDDESPPSEKTISDEAANWNAAMVTLDDGTKYEIVKQLEHDPYSFM